METTERTILEPNAVTFVPTHKKGGTWLLEPHTKWATVQAVVAVYEDVDRIAVINTANQAYVWEPGISIGTAIPLREGELGMEERNAAIKAIRSRRRKVDDGDSDEDTDTESLHQLFKTWGWQRTKS